MRRWFVVIALSFTRPLSAQENAELPIELLWDAPAGCGNVEVVLAQVREMLGTTPIDSSRRVRAEVIVRRNQNGGVELTLVTREGDSYGERTIALRSCDDAAHTAALLLTLQLDPSRAEEQPSEPRPAPTSTPAAAPAPTTRNTLSASNATPSRRPVARPELGAYVAVDSGSLPHLGLGASIGAALRFEAAQLIARGSLWAPNRATSGEQSGAGARFHLYDAALLACFNWLRERSLTPELCAGVSALYLRGKGYGVTEPSAASALYWGGLGEVALRLTLSETWSLRLAGNAMLVGPRHDFAIRNLDVLHRPAAVSGRLLFGTTCTF